jgi:signal transduction histidine kinase
MATIAILSGMLEGHTFEVDKPVITVGRRADNDVSVPLDPGISRFHAQLSKQGEGWVLEDLGSANGTFVGQRKIHGPTPIAPNQRFRMGRTWLSVLPEQAAASTAGPVENIRLMGTSDSPDPVAEPLSNHVIYSVDVEEALRATEGQEAQRRLGAMSRISAALSSSLDLSHLLDAILVAIMEVIPAERAFVMLIDRLTGEFVPRAVRYRDPSRDHTEFPVSRHILGYSIRERVAVMTADAMSDERFENLASVRDLRIRSAICAPLLQSDQALGTLFIDSTSATHVFSETDVEMLMTIGGQVATAIQNALLYSDLQQAYQSLQSAQDQLLSTERLSTVGALSAGIAHDMANVVTPLKPLMMAVLKDHHVDPEAYDSLNRQMDRLRAMLERLLSFSRTEKLQYEPVSVNEVIPKTLALIRAEIMQRQVEVETELEPNVPDVLADAAQLDRVFLNLALNALEAMEESPERVLAIHTVRDGEEVAVSFKDTGPGIAVANQERLFEPLFTTKATGTGLGLFSCRRIIEEEHHGTIELDSVPGHGATFTVRLPAIPDDEVVDVSQMDSGTSSDIQADIAP